MKQAKNVLIVGVGGQGVLLASELLSKAAVTAGYDAKQSEVHGMAQRGGVVTSHVRISEKVQSPLIQEGHADVILAFEMAEALRWVHFLKSGGTIIINDYRLVPPVALMKGSQYPEDPIAAVKKRVRHVIVVDAPALSRELGNPKLVNTVLLGVLSQSLDIPVSDWEAVIMERVPKGTEELNRRAFLKGREFHK